MYNKITTILSLVLLTLSFPTATFAADTIEALEQDIEKDSKQAMRDLEDAYEDAYNTLDELSEGLSQKEKQHLFLMQMNQSMIGKVADVQTSVSNAVKECGKNNAEMKSDMDARYKIWNDAITPVMKEADANLNNMMIAQDYAPKDKIKGAFKAMKNARTKATNQIEKIPVTTPEACQFLLDKMDETQENMVELLSSTLVGAPQVFQNQWENQPDPTPIETDGNLTKERPIE